MPREGDTGAPLGNITAEDKDNIIHTVQIYILKAPPKVKPVQKPEGKTSSGTIPLM